MRGDELVIEMESDRLPAVEAAKAPFFPSFFLFFLCLREKREERPIPLITMLWFLRRDTRRENYSYVQSDIYIFIFI